MPLKYIHHSRKRRILMEKKYAEAAADLSLMKQNMEKVIIGKSGKIDLLLIAFLCRGHVLINDVPGLGKTIMARAFAGSLGALFRRIQCTPDLLPSDLTGISIYNPDTKKFLFRKGPVFSQILLIDEINRATPRTQSALLEAMGENQVSIEGLTMQLPDPFFVIGTQNPVEFEGTFPLPEAQMDRFFLSFDIGYPDAEEELQIIEGQRLIHPIESLQQIIDIEKLAVHRQTVREVFVEQDLRDYIVRIVSATRKNERLALGSSPRGSLALFRAAQAFALLCGRDFVIPDDIKKLIIPVLAHRLILKADAGLKGYSAESLLREISSALDVPIEDREEAGD